MEQSLFLQWVEKYLTGVTVSIVEKLNDTTNPLSYLHKTMLRKEYSVNGKWESISAANSLVMADVVAMDSPLPLKNRDSISKANGDIPKMGMELKLNEQQLTDLDTLIAQGGTDAQILAKIFNDLPKVIGGIYERNEYMFLQGLSTGVTLVQDADNTGTGVRLDYGFPAGNKFGSEVIWATAATAKPFDDIQRVLDKATLDGNTITVVMMDKTAFNNLAKTTQAKEQFAFSLNFVGSNIQVPSMSQLNAFTSDRYGFTIQVTDRSFKAEKNGTQSSTKAWADGAVVLLPGLQVGTLMYAKLAEENHPVANVSYTKADDFILVSKYRQNKPSLSEYTSSQARVVPVISNVDQIYLLDSKTVQE